MGLPLGYKGLVWFHREAMVEAIGVHQDAYFHWVAPMDPLWVFAN